MKILRLLSALMVSAYMGTAINFDDVDKLSEQEMRIYGGDDADASKVPYMVTLRKALLNDTYCGAALVAPQYVITAAHCVKNVTMYASIGSQYREGDKDGERIEVVDSYVHPLYNAALHTNDVAILKLKKSSTIKPVTLCKPDGSESKENTIAVVRGWGVTESGNVSDTLKEVNVRIQSNAQCNKLFNDRITEGMLCAGQGGGKDACQGDSGGPLVNGNVMIGIVSWGGTCGEKPGVYTRLTSVLDFIYEKIGKKPPVTPVTIAPTPVPPVPTPERDVPTPEPPAPGPEPVPSPEPPAPGPQPVPSPEPPAPAPEPPVPAPEPSPEPPSPDTEPPAPEPTKSPASQDDDPSPPEPTKSPASQDDDPSPPSHSPVAQDDYISPSPAKKCGVTK